MPKNTTNMINSVSQEASFLKVSKEVGSGSSREQEKRKGSKLVLVSGSDTLV